MQLKTEEEVRARVDEILDIVSNTTYIIDSYMDSKKNYNKFIELIFQYLRDGFEFKELREAPTYFKFHKDSTTMVMQLRHFLTNLIFWSPVIPLKAVEDLDESFLVDTTAISAKYIKSYIDTMVIDRYRQTVSNKKMNIIIHDLMHKLAQISSEFNILLGLTMNIETFINVANENERFDEIIHTKLDDTKQPKEIEDYLHNLMNEEVEILKTVDNPLKPILRSGTGIKTKQLAEMSISGGFKPDVSGSTMPIPINTNLVVGGLKNTTNYFIDACGQFFGQLCG